MKVFYLNCDPEHQYQFTPTRLIIFADSEQEACEIAKDKEGDGFKVIHSCEIKKGIVSKDYQ
jgi:hypothetical protein